MGSGFLGASTTRTNPNAGGGIGAWEEGQSFKVFGISLRHFYWSRTLRDPLFIKMDVEGSEEEILQDVDFFAEHKPILYLETHPWWWKDEQATRKNIDLIGQVCKVIQ